MVTTLHIKDDGLAELSGELTFDTVAKLWLENKSNIDRGQVLLIDLSAVSHGDSAGLALLMEWLRATKKAGFNLQFIEIPPQLCAIAQGANVEWIFSCKLNKSNNVS